MGPVGVLERSLGLAGAVAARHPLALPSAPTGSSVGVIEVGTHMIERIEGLVTNDRCAR